jgi:cell division protein ZapA (FtsZ GTPase activity inhibitor)
MNTFKIDILGREFYFKSDESGENIEQIKMYLEKKIENTKQNLKDKHSTHLPVLVLLETVDELIKTKNYLYEQNQNLTNKVEGLIKYIDESLKQIKR